MIVAVSEGVNPDGKMTERTRAVVEQAVELLKGGKGDIIVFTDGAGFRFVDRTPISEGAAMREYAISLGTPKECIMLTEKHVDTLGNALFSKPIAETLGIHDITLVAGRWHMLRTSYIFNMVFGPDYRINPVRSRDTFTQEQLDRVLPAEMVSLSLTMSYFQQHSVRPGDDKAIMKMMLAEYKYYNPQANETESRQMMRRELNRQRNKQPIVDQKY